MGWKGFDPLRMLIYANIVGNIPDGQESEIPACRGFSV